MNTNAIESWLDGIGVQYERINLAVSAIDFDKSLRNQARFGQPLSDDHVSTFMEAKRQGAGFPPIVAFQNGSPKVVLGDGNHRAEAFRRLGVPSIDAYVVKDPTEAQKVRILYEANLGHGLPSSITDRLHHARHLIEKFGLSQAQAAERMNIPANRLSQFMRRMEARERLQSLRVKAAESEKVYECLYRLRNEAAFRAAAQASFHVSTEQMEKLTTEANRASSEAEMVAVFTEAQRQAEFASSMRGGLPDGPRKATTAQRLARVANVRGSLPTVEEAKSLPVPMQQNARRKLVELVKAVERIIEALDA